MASYLTQRPLIIQDENLDLHHKSSAFDGNVKSTKAAAKKYGGGLGSRKALNDITNKTSLKSEASTRKRNITKEQFKKNIPKEDFNVAEEGFLHDHTKCIEEQKSRLDIASFLDLVLPGHDSDAFSESTADHLKIDLDDKLPFPELKGVSMFKSLAKWNSPPDSPPSPLFESPPFSISKRNSPPDFPPFIPFECSFSISKWNSPYSPDSLEPDSPFPWCRQFEDVHFVLKQENDYFDADSSV